MKYILILYVEVIQDLIDLFCLIQDEDSVDEFEKELEEFRRLILSFGHTKMHLWMKAA